MMPDPITPDGVRRLTKRERRIQRLAEEIEFGGERRQSRPLPAVEESRPNPNEVCFVQSAKRRGFSDVSRGGWPDFMVRRPDRKLVGVEVKTGNDTISGRQALMFSLLNECGIPVFVWWSDKPNVLIPWRKFHDDRTKYLYRRMRELRKSLHDNPPRARRG